MKINLYVDRAGIASIINGTEFVGLYKPTASCNIEICVDVKDILDQHGTAYGCWVRSDNE